MRRPAWVVMTYVVLLLLAVATALPNFLPTTVRSTLPDWATSQTVSLGLDLQGGAHLLLAVDREDLAEARLQELRETLVAEMRARNLNPGAIRTEGLALSVPADEALFATMQSAAAATAQPGSPADFSVDLSDGTLQLTLTEAGLDRAATIAADSSLEVIRHRVDQVGVSEPVLSRVGGDRILVQMPGIENPGQLRELLGSTAKMSFQMVAPGPGPGVSMLGLRDGSGAIPVEDLVALSGDRLARAASAFDPDTGRPMVTFAFDRPGGIAFAEITAANIGQRFAVVLDGTVLTAPVIQTAIPGGQGQITGDFTVEEAQTLAVLLTSGAMPASLEVIEERSVGAALGADLFIFAVPVALPIAIPGISAVLGAPLLFLSWQLMRGHEKPWLPELMHRRSFRRADFASMLLRVLPSIRRVERLVGPRLIWLTNRRGEKVLGLFAFALAVVLFLPIPFGNTLPALAIAIMALAVLERDGLAAIAGALTGFAGVAVVSGVVVGLVKGAVLLLQSLFLA